MVEFWCLDPPFSEQILLYRYLRYNCYLVREISIECQEYSCVTLGKKFFCTLWWSRGLASLQPLWRGYQGWIKWVLTLVELLLSCPKLKWKNGVILFMSFFFRLWKLVSLLMGRKKQKKSKLRFKILSKKFVVATIIKFLCRSIIFEIFINLSDVYYSWWIFLQFLPVKSRSETTEGHAVVGDLQSDEQTRRVGTLC